MLISFFNGVLWLFAGYIFARLFVRFLPFDKDALNYELKRDVYAYVWLFMFASALLLKAFAPSSVDAIFPLLSWQIALLFILSAFIYFAFLTENKKFLYLCVAVSSVLAAYLLTPQTDHFFGIILPYVWVIVCLSALVFVLTLASYLLAALVGVYALFVSVFLISAGFLSLAGGLPVWLGVTAVLWAGLWIGIYQFNAEPQKITLNTGASLSMGFLLSCFMLKANAEMAGSSVLILFSFIIAELILSAYRRYILRSEETNLALNTSHFIAYQQVLNGAPVYVLVLKIGIINGALALFQLYSENAFSLPVLALVINLWMLSKMFEPEEKKTFKQLNQDFVKDLKSGIETLKDALKKDK